MLYRLPFFWKIFFFAFTLLVINGCSQKFKSTTETIKAAYSGTQDVDISSQQINQLPYASIFLRINNGPNLFLILGYDDINQTTGQHRFTWVSADQSSIVTENGRIIASSGFNGDNLVGVSGIPYTPNLMALKNWTAHYDWMPGYRYQFTAQVTPLLIGNETLSNDSWTKQTSHIVETVTFADLDASFQNNYWVETSNQGSYRVVKSIQYFGPEMYKVEITLVKPYAFLTTQGAPQ